VPRPRSSPEQANHRSGRGISTVARRPALDHQTIKASGSAAIGALRNVITPRRPNRRHVRVASGQARASTLGSGYCVSRER
jgi:hypothetical protein